MTTDRALRPALDAFEREILEFLVTWLPYGGPPVEETLPRFGIHADDFSVRVCEIVAAGLSRGPGGRDAVLLHRSRLAMAALTAAVAPVGGTRRAESRYRNSEFG